MKMRYGFYIISVASLGGWLGTAVSFQSLDRSTPFVAHIEKRFKKSENDPNPSTLNITYARKTDGSFVQMFDSKSPDGKQTELMSEIYDAQTTRHILLEQFTKSAVIWNYSAVEYYQVVHALESENCESRLTNDAVTSSEKRVITMFGRKAIRQVERLPFPTATDTQLEWMHERYVVPELRCFPFHVIDRRSDGPVTEEEVVSFKEGEPPASYFEVPAVYVERSPNEMNQAYAKKFGQGHEFWAEPAVQGLERRHQRLKKALGSVGTKTQ